MIDTSLYVSWSISSSYHEITLLTLPRKVFSRVLEGRLRSDSRGTVWLPSSTCDSGSDLDPVRDAKWVVGVCIFGLHVLKEASDHVPWDILWGVLREYGVCGLLLTAIQSLCDQSMSCVTENFWPEVELVLSVGWTVPCLRTCL